MTCSHSIRVRYFYIPLCICTCRIRNSLSRYARHAVLVGNGKSLAHPIPHRHSGRPPPPSSPSPNRQPVVMSSKVQPSTWQPGKKRKHTLKSPAVTKATPALFLGPRGENAACSLFFKRDFFPLFFGGPKGRKRGRRSFNEQTKNLRHDGPSSQKK